MPNGGSDCCGTCWFNRKNHGQAFYRYADDSEPAHCEIRDVPIPIPFWTYCANHPRRQPAKDLIPIGPIYRANLNNSCHPREVWIPSPDTEAIRQRLLQLLNGFPESTSHDQYPESPGLTESIIWQLGEFREPRALPMLQWIAENSSNNLRDFALRALESIQS